MLEMKPGDEAIVELPFSEVNMHMKVAGKRMKIKALPASWDHSRVGSVQILQEDGSPYSSPILPSEAGVKDWD